MAFWLMLVALRSLAAPPVEAPPTVKTEVWGTVAFHLAGDAVDLMWDADGRPCAVDVEGVVCFDSGGVPGWALDISGIDEVVEGEGAWALRIGEDLTVVDNADGRVLLRANHGWAARAASGKLLVLDPEGFGAVDGPALVPLEDTGPVAGLLARDDGGIGIIRPEGTLRWIGPDGSIEGDVDPGLAATGGVIAEPLPDGGFALLDDAGLVILDADGEVRSEVALDGDDLTIAGGEILVATEDGVWAVDAASGVVDPVPEAPASTLVAADGDRVVVVGERRLRIWDGEVELQAGGHLSPIRAVAPAPDGRVLTVDAGGRAVLWSAAGRPQVLPYQGVVDAGWGAGQAWLALGGRAVALPAPGKPAREVPGPARFITSLPDGVLLGDGGVVRRVAATGDVRWTAAAPHDRRPTVSIDVDLAFVVGANLDILDLTSGARRRRLFESGIVAARADRGQVSIWFERGSGTAVARPLDRWDAADRAPAWIRGRGPSASPGGPWAATWDGEQVALTDDRGRELYARAPVAKPTAWIADPTFVYLGLEDGRVERWAVSEVVLDASPREYEVYAQVEPFVTPPAGAPTRVTVDLGVGPARIIAGVDGAALAFPPWLELRPDRAPRQLVIPGARAAAGHPEKGWVILTQDGKLLDGAGATIGEARAGALDFCWNPRGTWVVEGAALTMSGGERPATIRLDPELPVTGLACGRGGGVGVIQGGRARIRSYVGDDDVWDAPHGGLVRAIAALPAPEAESGGTRPTAGGWATGGEDEVVALWHPKGSLEHTLDGHGAPVTSLAAAERWLLAGAGDQVVLWDLEQLSPHAAWSIGAPVRDVSLSEDGRFAWVLDATGRATRFDLPDIEALRAAEEEQIPRFDSVKPPVGAGRR